MAVLNLDFEGIESGAGYLPAGSYRAKVQSIELKEGKKADYLNWCFASVAPGTEGMVGYLMTSLADSALWKLKRTLEALGAEIPQTKLRIDTDKFLGRVAIIHVVDEPYTGSDGITRSSFKVSDVFVDTQQAPTTAAAPAVAPAPAYAPEDLRDVDFGSDDIPF